MDESLQLDICRVCRCEGTPDRPLFHPCICTGSIKFIHQECLVQWLRYSRKEYCELCTHRFSFTPIYSPDMPKRLPLKDILSGLVSSLARAIRFWLHYTLVAMAWLGIVPLTACRIYRCLFTGSVSSVLTLPLDMLSSEHVATDILHGCVVVLCTLCAFIGLVWLREQILHGGGPDWLEQDIQNEEHNEVDQPAEGPGNDADNLPAQNNVRADINMEGVADANIPAANNAGQPGQAPAQGQAQDDVNWNLMEWDRAEELTWERLLGLDGSLVFLEHVFWVASLNTLFILVFAFCPYHIGHFTIVGFKMKEWVSACHFEGLLTTLCGYVVIGLFLVLLHGVTSLLHLRRPKRILGLCYVVVKVSLLTVAEIGVFPIVCGWWLDICSLPLVDATLQDRLQNFSQARGTSMFLHWLVGILCAFYFASFVLLLREVLRPGVLWFLRNLNDPDFNPVQEMIHLPIVRHLRQFAASLVIFGTIVFLMLWVPIRILQKCMPKFLPYYIVNSTDTQVSEYSLELLLLQVIMPCLLEQNHARQWLLYGLRMWCLAVSWLLGLRSYLLGDEASASELGEGLARQNNQGDVINGEEEEEFGNDARGDHQRRNQPAAPAPLPPAPAAQAQDGNAFLGGVPFRNGGLGAAHQALLQREGPAGYVPYLRPQFFFIRIILLLFIMCISLSVVSTIFLTVPVWIGRFLMETFYGEGPHHELYTAFAGLYFCWLFLRGIHVFSNLVPRGWSNVFGRIKSYTVLVLKCTVAFSLLLGVIPLLFGLLLDLVVVVPLRVAVNQSPIFSLSQDWSLGVLYTKIVCGLTMMSDWWLKHSLEKLYQDGIRRMNLTFVLCELAIPAIVALGLALALPYVVAYSIVPLFVPSRQYRALIARRVYPSFLVVILLMVFSVWQLKQFKRLYEHIKNDKYLVGRRLVNYNHRNENTQTT